MSFLDEIGDVLNRYQEGTGASSREEAHAHYDQIADKVPQSVLASTIGPALGTLESPEVERRVSRSAAQMTPQQRGGLLGSLIGALPAAGGLSGLLSRIGVPPTLAQNPEAASPEDVGRVAAYTKDNHSEVFNRAMGFYAEHPTLVKVMGTLAVAAIAKRLAGGRRPGLL